MRSRDLSDGVVFGSELKVRPLNAIYNGTFNKSLQKCRTFILTFGVAQWETAHQTVEAQSHTENNTHKVDRKHQPNYKYPQLLRSYSNSK